MWKAKFHYANGTLLFGSHAQSLLALEIENNQKFKFIIRGRRHKSPIRSTSCDLQDISWWKDPEQVFPWKNEKGKIY